VPEPVRAAAPPAAEIVSPVAAAASRSALDSLSALIVKPEVTGSDTLEGMVREMLRPMLKEWLDANLPDVVERVVSKEVARISGR
jgi:cell pole-organizing protein PopZ